VRGPRFLACKVMVTTWPSAALAGETVCVTWRSASFTILVGILNSEVLPSEPVAVADTNQPRVWAGSTVFHVAFPDPSVVMVSEMRNWLACALLDGALVPRKYSTVTVSFGRP